MFKLVNTLINKGFKEETAVSHYTNLIQQAPNSPWSWLAWARLEPVDSD